MLDFGGHDLSFGVIGHITEVPGGDGVFRWTVRTDLHGEEMICFVLTLELGGKLCLRDALSLNLRHCLVLSLHGYFLIKND